MDKVIKKILREETDSSDIDQQLYLYLMRRVKIKRSDLGDSEDPLYVKNMFFNIDGETYGFSSFIPKKQMIYKIVNMLEENDIINIDMSNKNQYNPEQQKIIKTIKKLVNHFMDEEITCESCGWSWKESESERKDLYQCHKCGHDNTKKYID